jgi:hypothetical protein
VIKTMFIPHTKCDKYYFTIFDHETDGVYEFSTKYHEYSSIKDFLITEFKDKMKEVEQFYANTGYNYIDEYIEIIRMHTIGWKVCIRKFREC